MISTILSVIFSIFVLFHSINLSINSYGVLIAGAVILVSFSYLVLSALTIVLTFSPLQKIEQNVTPRLFSLLKQDTFILGVFSWSTFFILATFAITLDFLFFNLISKNISIAVWIILFGISGDVYLQLLKRMMSYLNPFDNIALFRELAKKNIQNDKTLELCDAVDSITEIGVKAVQRHGTAISSQALQECQIITKHFFESSKSIAHVEADIESKKIGIKDRISFTLFYILDHINLIYEEALTKKLEQVITNVVSVFGKITIQSANFDLSLTSYPVHYLTNAATKAMQKGLHEIGIKATLTLHEVSRTIIEEVDYQYNDLKEPFFSIINGMEEIAKVTFLEDKNTHMNVLTQPFRDLKILFQNPKVINHQDRDSIVQNIDRVLGEYASLEIVMKTIPPIPDDLKENK